MALMKTAGAAHLEGRKAPTYYTPKAEAELECPEMLFLGWLAQRSHVMPTGHAVVADLSIRTEEPAPSHQESSLRPDRWHPQRPPVCHPASIQRTSPAGSGQEHTALPSHRCRSTGARQDEHAEAERGARPCRVKWCYAIGRGVGSRGESALSSWSRQV